MISILYIAMQWSLTPQVSNKLLSLLDGFLFSHLVIPGEATKAVWPEYWYGPEYEEGCVDPLANDGSAPDCPYGYEYGLMSQETFGYRLPGDTSECGSKNAPLIRLIPGKKYKLIFINSTKSPTNLHTHGLHIDGNGYADDAFRQVKPGMCLEYHWDIYEVC